MTLDEILQLRDAIDRSLRADSRPIVATLVARDGHSYREPGDMMVMTETLELIGGVSGGCLENYIARVGRELLRDRLSVLMSFDTTTEEPGKPTLGCGGRLEVLVELGRTDHLQYLDALASAMRSSDRAATLIRFADDGARPAAHECRSIVVEGEVVFGRPVDGPERGLLDEAINLRETLTHRGSIVRTASYLWPQQRLAVFGAQDDARPLVEIAKTASWHVTVLDRRARLATRSRFPAADRVLAASWEEAVAAIDWTPWTAAIVLTHSFEDDVELLPLLARQTVGYLGVLGPASRAQRLRDAMPELNMDAVHSPIGLPLGDKSPAGIAISIMAELLAWRRGTRLPAATPREVRA